MVWRARAAGLSAGRRQGEITRPDVSGFDTAADGRQMGRKPNVNTQRTWSRGGVRERMRTRDGKREPLADRVPRSVKRAAGRTPASLIPANIRVDGVRLDEDDRAYIRRRLGEKLGKYASSIERVTVRVRDINGPRGGIDLLCRIKVVLSSHPSVVVEHKAALLRPGLTRALSGVERAVRQAVQRRRMRPIRWTADRDIRRTRSR